MFIRKVYKIYQMTKITVKTFKIAIQGTGGVLSNAASKLHVSRMAITSFIKRNPSVQKFVDQERERLIDVAEDVFKEALSLKTNDENMSIKNKNALMKIKMRAAEKVVSTIGKNRGWVPREQREHSGAINYQPVKIEIVSPNVKTKKEGEKLPSEKKRSTKVATNKSET